MRMFASLTAVLVLTFGTTGCAFTDFFHTLGNDVHQHVIADIDQVASHVNTFTGSVSVDPLTGMITVSGEVGFKEMEAATALSNKIIARNEKRGIHVVPAIQTPADQGRALDACGAPTRDLATMVGPRDLSLPLYYETRTIVPGTQDTITLPSYYQYVPQTRVINAPDACGNARALAEVVPVPKTMRVRVLRETTVTQKTKVKVTKNISLWRGFLCVFGIHPHKVQITATMPVADYISDTQYVGQTAPPAASQPSAAAATGPAVTAVPGVAADGSFTIPPAKKDISAQPTLEQRMQMIEQKMVGVDQRLQELCEAVSALNKPQPANKN